MKILVIGTIDNRGGAAQMSWELRKRLKRDGHTVSTFVRYKYSNEEDVSVVPRARWQDWLVRLFANDLRFARTEYIFDTKEYKEADVIHCHNLHSNFFNLKDLIRMSREKPVIWTMHDIWAITGFASDSATLKNPNKKRFLLYLWDRTPALLRAKKRIYDKSKLTVVAVSDWLKGRLESSVLAGQNIVRIYNGVDLAIFRPRSKAAVRQKLGLPLGKKIVGFGIKGWTDSALLMERFTGRDDVFFVAVGHSNIPDAAHFKSFGFVTDKDLMADILSSLDAFFYPSQGDTFGLSPAEAQACGVPVVTYAIDALPEIVAHKENGYVARPGDIADAAAGIEYCFGLAREIKSAFDIEKTYAEYLALYKRSIESFRKP